MMSGMHLIDAAERRRRLAVRHGLANPVSTDPADVARSVVVLHSTDPATVYLSIRARAAASVTPAVIEDCLYERRDLVRMLAMRRTVFILPTRDVPVVQAAATDKIAMDQRTTLVKHLRDLGGVADAGPWLADVEASVLRIFTERPGPLAATELSAAEPRLKTQLKMAEGKAYQATVNITSRVLLLMAAQGLIVRGRPIGTWVSQQYRWSLLEHWVPAVHAAAPPDAGTARVELARQWLAAFGPAPATDLKWWTGWTVAQTKLALAALGAVEVDLGGGTGMVLPDDLASTDEQTPWVAFLPALDPTTMGWAERSWYLGEHKQTLFDTNGNAGPTIWVDGQIVGGWAQTPAGEIAIRVFDDVGADATKLIEAEAERVGAWLGPVRVIPRFRTPTERELSS
jgi:hypothetical protein